jgi:hypothetical protein
MRTDKQTDTTKLIVAYRNFANAPKSLSQCHSVHHKPLSFHYINTAYGNSPFGTTNIRKTQKVWTKQSSYIKAAGIYSNQGVGLRPLAYWDCGFESHLRHGCLSLVSVVCCQVKVSATG